MEEPIKRHNFEKAMKKIKKFSEQTITDLDLKKIDSDKGVGEILGDFLLGRGLGLDHKVTGSELNELTVQIQSHLISINKMQKNFIDEIGNVYKALEALDKDYIQGILIDFEAAQKANKEVKIAQDNIKKTVDGQKKIIKVLQKFKEKLDNFDHIEDIDKIWNEIQEFRISIYENQASIDKLDEFKNKIDKYKHLSEVDKIWKDNQSHKKDIEDIKMSAKKLSSSLSEQIEDLFCKLNSQANILSSNEEILNKLNSIEHIYEVNDIWNRVDDTAKKVNNISEDIQKYTFLIEKNNKAIDDMIIRMKKIDFVFEEYEELKEHVKMLNQNKDSLEKKNNDLYSRLEEEHDKLEEIKNRFSKKMKISYPLAGGSIGLVVIEFILIILGLI